MSLAQFVHPCNPFCDPDSHYFVIKNSGRMENGQVIVQCERCSLGKDSVVGRDQIEDGKIVPRHNQ